MDRRSSLGGGGGDEEGDESEDEIKGESDEVSGEASVVSPRVSPPLWAAFILSVSGTGGGAGSSPPKVSLIRGRPLCSPSLTPSTTVPDRPRFRCSLAMMSCTACLTALWDVISAAVIEVREWPGIVSSPPVEVDPETSKGHVGAV